MNCKYFDRVGYQRHVQDGHYSHDRKLPLAVHAVHVGQAHRYVHQKDVYGHENDCQFEEPCSDVFSRDVVNIKAQVIIACMLEILCWRADFTFNVVMIQALPSAWCIVCAHAVTEYIEDLVVFCFVCACK